jgi:hypothetical protein
VLSSFLPKAYVSKQCGRSCDHAKGVLCDLAIKKRTALGSLQSLALFCRCRAANKRARIPLVKNCPAALIILALLSATSIQAEDFKTISGKVYKDATVSRVEGDGIVLKTKTGISKVYFVELPKDVQEKFHYRQGTPLPPQRQREAIKLEPTQTGPRQGNGGPKIVVVGQHSGFAGALPISGMKLLGVGALIICGLVLFIVRRRSHDKQ